MTQPNERENFSQAETVIRLQEAIEQLNSIVSQLNTGTGIVLPPKVAVDNLLNSTQQLAAALKPDEFAGSGGNRRYFTRFRAGGRVVDDDFEQNSPTFTWGN